MAVDEAGGNLWYQADPAIEPVVRSVEGSMGEVVEIPGLRKHWAVSLPFDSGIGLLPAAYNAEHDKPPALLPLKGRANLAPTRPLGLAFDVGRSLLAAANRSGGSIHLIVVEQEPKSR